MILRLKHVKRVHSKGRTYWYHRITGERLPVDPEERAARVFHINGTLKGTRQEINPGSVADLIVQYKGAPEYRRLMERTRREYLGYLDLISTMWGSQPITAIERKHVMALRDKFAETPGKANKIVTVLRIILAFAQDRDFRRDNAAVGIKKLKMGSGYRAWPDESVAAFLDSAPPMMALALKIGMYTGQREGDVLAMTWHDYDGNNIRLVQNKTGTKLTIPVHSDLKKALDAQDRVSPMIVTTATGKPFEKDGSNFRHHFGKVRKAAGLHGQGLVFHGLRYTAAKMLADVGCTTRQIAAITGHKSLAMIEKYTQGVDQERLAGAAILNLENAKRTKNGKPR